MAPHPAISVVMGVFNNASLLPETLASVQAQTEADFEFIIVNDGSSDPRVREMLADYARRDSRFRVISKSNEGLTRALIDGCAAARGTYIARIDAGDVMTPDRIYRQKALLDQHPDVVLVTSWTEFCGPQWEHLYTQKSARVADQQMLQDGWIANVLQDSDAADLATGATHHGSTMFRRTTYSAAGGYRPQFYYGQDWDLWYRLAELGTFAGVQATLYRCRVFPDGISMLNPSLQQRVHACSLGAFHARRQHQEESRFLETAAGFRPRPDVCNRKPAAAGANAAGFYFIAEALRRNGDLRCRRYFWLGIRKQPCMLKNWARLAQSICMRDPVQKQDRCHAPAHIAILAPNCCDGSVGSVAWRHAIELSRWFSVHVISKAIPNLPNDRIHAVQIHPLQWNFLRRFCHVPNALSFEWSARRRLRTLCRRVPIATVWCHGHASVVLAANPLRKRCGFRILMTTHGDIRDRPDGTYSRELTCYYRLLTRPAYRRTDAVQAISPYMAELARSGGARNVHVIPHGIDISDIGLRDVPVRTVTDYAPEGIVRLLYVGNLLSIKGVDVLLKAIACLQKAAAKTTENSHRAESLPIRLKLAGGGGEGDRYTQLAADLGIADIVEFLGKVPRTELGQLYLSSDAICVPSLSEALSIAGLEGMSCGLPVIGSRTGGISYLVEDTKTGRLSQPGDADGLAHSIRDVCLSRERLALMGRAAQRRAVERFSWPRIADALREVVQETLSNA